MKKLLKSQDKQEGDIELKVFVKYLKIFLRIFLWPVYWLSGFFPRDPKIWVLGCYPDKGFNDNSKYFYCWINKNKQDEVRAIWITKRKYIANTIKKFKLEAYYLYSLKGLYYLLRAKVWIYTHETTDLTFWLSRKVFKVNLWHGIPLKVIQHDRENNKYYIASKLKKVLYKVIAPWVYEGANLVLVPSNDKKLINIFNSAFRTSKDFVCDVYPRTYFLVNRSEFHPVSRSVGVDTDLLEYLEKERQKGAKIISYFPTFRDNYEEDFFRIVDLKIFDSFLDEKNAYLIIKFHINSFLSKRSLPRGRTLRKLFSFLQRKTFTHICLSPTS